MAKRQYLPHAWLDEIVPALRDHPSDWIGNRAFGVLAIVDPDGDFPPIPLKIGDIIEFSWREIYGFVTIQIAADRSFTCDRPVDPRTNCVWEPFDPDTFSESVEAFVANYHGEPPLAVEVETYSWAEIPEKYRFEAGPDGPRFFRLEA